MLGLGTNGSDSTQKSSSDKDSNDSSDDFLANELNTSMTMAQCQVFHVRKIPEEVFEQSHVSHQNKYTQQTQT